MKNWNIKWFILFNLASCILIISYLIPYTRDLWTLFDLTIFKFLNHTLINSPFWQNFWAFGNTRWLDHFRDFYMFAFFLAYIFKNDSQPKITKLSQFFFCILCLIAVIGLVNELVFRYIVDVYRNSPSVIVEPYVNLTKTLSWVKVKCFSIKSFPADHGTSALITGICISFFNKKPIAITGWILSIFACMPRLFVGAHGVSDIIISSGAIAMIFSALVFCTPLHLVLCDYIEKILKKAFKTRILSQ